MKWVALCPLLVVAGLIAVLVLNRQQMQSDAEIMQRDGAAMLAGFQALEGRLGCQGRVVSGQLVVEAVAAMIACADAQRVSEDDAMRKLAEQLVPCPDVAR